MSFGGYLRHTTQAQQRVYGPLVMSSDAVTVYSIGIAASDVNIVKNNVGSASTKNSGAGVYLTGGQHVMTYNSTDSSTIGSLRVYTNLSSSLPFSQDYVVLAANVYDALFNTTGTILPVDVEQINLSAISATNLAQNAQAVVTTIANSNGGTLSATNIFTNLTQATDNFYQSRSYVFISGTLAGQGGTILTYTGATKLITGAAMTGTPVHGDILVIT